MAQGEAPGVARQLQHAASAGQVLLSSRVAEAASARYESRQAPDAGVRYRGGAVGALALLGPRASMIVQDGAGALQVRHLLLLRLRVCR